MISLDTFYVHTPVWTPNPVCRTSQCRSSGRLALGLVTGEKAPSRPLDTSSDRSRCPTLTSSNLSAGEPGQDTTGEGDVLLEVESLVREGPFETLDRGLGRQGTGGKGTSRWTSSRVGKETK